MSEELNEVVTNQNESQVDTPTAEAPEAVTEEKTFTQAEVDKILAERLGRANKKLDKFADYDEIKTKASEYEKQLEEKRLAELTEKERLEEIAKKHEEEKLSLSQELETMRESVKASKIRNEFNKVATGNYIAHLDDAFTLADLSAVTIDEEGKVVGMEDAIKSLVDNKPFLLAPAIKTQKPIGEPTNGGSVNEEVRTLEAQLDDAKKSKDFTKVVELSNKIAGFIKK